MPIPVINDHYSAQVIFSGMSGQPEDVFTNTFYFHNNNFGGTHDSVADQLRDDLSEFYTVNATNVTGGVSIVSRLAGAVLNTSAEVRVYDLGQAAPRYPKIRTFPLTGAAATALPSEVAACLSYVGGQNQPRYRGRIYLGPLATAAGSVVDGRQSLSSGFIIGALGAAYRLMQKPSFEWCVYSPTDNAMRVITGAWMDDAFDTQRRRGEKAQSRQTIGQYLGQKGTLIVPSA